MNIIISIFCTLSALTCLFVKLRYELQMMQQNSYRNSRYLNWLKKDLLSQRRIIEVAILLLLGFLADNIHICVLASIVFIILIVKELRMKYKKKLVFTSRAIRLYFTAGLAAALVAFVVFEYSDENIGHVIQVVSLMTVLSFLVLIIANIINIPVEKMISRWFYNDAKKILEKNPNLTVIGITGSYGKTSTKHFLYRMLSEDSSVLMTPGSYNTLLGVVRTIRENMKPYHDFFIVEMGAKQAGDIKEICDLVHPTVGILTSVGEQHLESFKAIENVQKTKFELIDALPLEGIAILNDDYEYIKNRPVYNVQNVIRYSFANQKADYYLDDIHYTKEKTNFTVKGKKEAANTFNTKIVGSHNLSNILASYIASKYLRIKKTSIEYAISQLEQVEHRLSISRTPQGITIIDDAFNSNPMGASMALDVIKEFRTGKRIVVTPGMIELGAKQYDLNFGFGKKMAVSCDYTIVVGSYNRDSIINGLHSNDFDKNNIFPAATFKDAVIHLNSILKSGDVVLYENDLPDTFK
ncbi:Mur ligase [Bacteroidia bacterium]|nr:Mur ligase [Bacteroidia bacterium]GHV07623.1 Mur ligase [Bacteroidia bacterium]